MCSLATLLGCQPESISIEKRYPGPWREPSPPVIKTLLANRVRGCGEFVERKSSVNEGEYLVYCTRDGNTWKAWLVWTVIDKVEGPTELPKEIRPPR
jgi:hypothetical protein